jgi:ubiquinone/menaquinone biosynthesis C-methylase UbiE
MDYFDTVADQWDQMRAGYFGESVREVAIAKANLRPDMVVADVGTGTGYVATGLAPLVQKVYGVDASAEMLRVAEENMCRQGLTNVEFKVGDGLNLPFEDNSLDAVFANMYLHHIEEPPLAIAEMVRVLKPGGVLVITDEDEHEHEWLHEEMDDVWLGFDRDQIAAGSSRPAWKKLRLTAQARIAAPNLPREKASLSASLWPRGSSSEIRDKASEGQKPER